MKVEWPAVVITGSLALAGCSAGAQSEEPAPELCYSRTDVSELPMDWITNVIGPRYNADEQALREGTGTFAEKLKDMSWGIPEGSDCVGYRESLVMTKEALLLSQAVNNGTDTDDAYESVANAGDDFMMVMEMKENGYSEVQVSFPTSAEEIKELVPDS